MAVSGSHDRRTYVRLVYSLVSGGHSGVLRVRFGPRNRWLYFLEGRPVLYRSDLAGDQFDHAAIDMGLLTQLRIDELREGLEPDQSLEDAAVASGELTWEDLTGFAANRLRLGLGSPLALASGEWAFDARPKLRLHRVDPGLIPDVHSMEALWRGVRQHVDMDEVLPAMTDTSGGIWRPHSDFESRFAGMRVQAPLDQLVEVVGKGTTIDEIFGAVQDTSGDLVRLLWFLESLGLLRRDGHSYEDKLGRRITRAVNRSGRSAPSGRSARPSARSAGPPSRKRKRTQRRKKPTGDVSLMIAQDYEARMGRDFYGFLGLDREAEGSIIDRACKLLVQRWRPLDTEPALTREDREKLAQLLRGVQLVWQTLIDPLRRGEYDARLKEGQAPVLEGIHVAVEGADGA